MSGSQTEGGWEGSVHDGICGTDIVHVGLKGLNMVYGVFDPFIWVNGWGV